MTDATEDSQGSRALDLIEEGRQLGIIERIGILLRALSARGRESIEAMVESVHALFSGDRETRRRVAFSVAMIALSAKMAKADGVVAASEVAAFQRIFEIPPEELRNVFRLYDLAKQDTAGFESYASRITTLCSEGQEHCQLLFDVLDGLFHIAKADGVVHERERAFLQRVAEVFHLTEGEYAAIENRHVAHGEAGDYAILGVSPSDSLPQIRARYLELVRENHPDRLAARGVPAEFLAIGTERMKAINAAYESVAKARAA
ncbi:J domain-containing protein [Aureimonas psammosilenae]|uniref:J domain-containing protein n=1 Tax=Aureimonas psammosilenae TaxID=2495496 RepID=UPI0012610C4C|nr:DnaJ family molecular chaperone [Aureimonas psammosilenae]